MLTYGRFEFSWFRLLRTLILGRSHLKTTLEWDTAYLIANTEEGHSQTVALSSFCDASDYINSLEESIGLRWGL